MPTHLLIDADDTLWENNIYFERAIEDFIDFLDHSKLNRHEIQTFLLEVELTIGYGSANFMKSLQETYRQLAERDIREEDLQQVRIFAEQITQHPIQLLPGVEETLKYLAPRYPLVVLTKGNEEEQKLKVENSGLEQYFQNILVVPEKRLETYQQVVQQLGFAPEQTWMIGNSPRSDINPALAAGLNTVFIPHSHTWAAEKEELTQGIPTERLLLLDTFAELRKHF